MSFKFTSNLKNIEAEFNKRTKKSLEDIGDFIVDEAKEKVPVKTGELKRSIEKDVQDNKLNVGSNLDYSVHVEIGSSGRVEKPYLGPAALENKSQLTSIAEKNFKSGW